ncbi:MAG TPA: UrcA family protein [Phenylobacterium sp.]|nr:UrcA family protein [Phenylobacterium sp.]
MKTLAFALAAVCLASGFASAHPPASRSAADGARVLRYAELDLTREQGASVLVGRIKQAAHTFCGPEPRLLSLGEHQRYRACVQETAGAAVKRVNAPLVTAVYQGDAERMRFAAR